MRTRLLALLLAGMLSVVGVALDTNAAQAASYPARAIQIIVPYPAGGSDSLIRRIAQGLSERMGKAVIVVNRPGASTMIATQAGVSAAPDGYTLVVGSPTEMTANPSLFENVPFDVLTDLTPVTLLAETPFVLFTNGKLKFQTLDELVAELKERPGKLNLGTFGVGSPPDLNARLFQMAAGVEVSLVPYTGGAPMLIALAGGEIDLAFATLIPTKPLMQTGAIRPLAVSLDRRSNVIPDVPTFRDKGINVAEGGGWALFGPKGLPTEIRDRLLQEIREVYKDPAVQKMAADMGVFLVGNSPDELSEKLKRDTKMWADTIPKFGLTKQRSGG
jgi:tripartite-type tricarboxylate transporter receptor subunit TctC